MLCLIAAEVIQRQRALASVNRGHGIANVLEAAQHHGRAKDFVLRNFSLGRRVDDQRQRQTAINTSVTSAHFHHLHTTLFGVLHIGADAGMVALVHYGRHISVAGDRGVQGLILGRNTIRQRLQTRLVHPDHIGRHTELTGVERLAHRNAFSHIGDVCGITNQHRRLATQLQRDRHQILGSRCHDELADCRGACEDQMVPGLLRKRCSHFGAALHHSQHLRIKAFGHSFCQHLRRARCNFGRLEHSAIARSKRTCQR